VILHTLIDNAYKYSPHKRATAASGKDVSPQDRPKVIVEFHEDDRAIDLSVLSYGPRIADNEKK